MHIALVLAATATAASAVQIPRGVSDKLASRYQPSATNTFTCLDGSQTIPYSSVNDDFCDCVDGSDEPGTSACPSGVFFCANNGHEPAQLPSNRVNDGVCDFELCCDGSDENTDNNNECENVCDKVAAIVGEERREKRRGTEEGIKAKREYLDLKVLEDEARAAEIQALEAEMEEFKARVESLRIEAEALEAKEDEIAAQYKPLEDVSTSTDTVEDPPLETVTPTSEEAFPDPPELIVAREAAEKARKVHDTANDALNGKQDYLTTLKTRHSQQLGFDGGLGILSQKEGCLEYDTNQEYIYKLCFFSNAVQHSKYSNSDTSLGTWSGFTGKDLTAYSGKNLLYTEGEFTGGLGCWNGPQRSMKVTFECGGRNEVLSVSEPNKCEYLARVVTPGACEKDEDVERNHAHGHEVGNEKVVVVGHDEL
ncbi:hypothetical protein HDU79_004592 [Rhizoclosmatium sp. JEL0117]|nr:hypothetical protein HDU79_004592 [Rhizoclosmatium sp. JEL0117]